MYNLHSTWNVIIIPREHLLFFYTSLFPKFLFYGLNIFFIFSYVTLDATLIVIIQGDDHAHPYVPTIQKLVLNNLVYHLMLTYPKQSIFQLNSSTLHFFHLDFLLYFFHQCSWAFCVLEVLDSRSLSFTFFRNCQNIDATCVITTWRTHL